MSETSGAMPGEKPAPNMNVSVERLSDVERKLDVDIPWEDVRGRLDEAYQELKQSVAIKGFRKGKVPRRMLEQLFGKHVVKEVAQRLVQDSIGKALTDHELSPVSEPQVEDQGVHEGQSFRYAATLQVVPEFEPADYFGVEIKRRPGQVTEEDVTAALHNKQQEMTAFRAIEGRDTQAGDVLAIDVIGKAGTRPIDFQNEIVELGDVPREPLPGLAALLTGIPAEEQEREVELAVPVPGEAGRTEMARLLVTVRDVRQKVVPTLDDDFAKDTGEAQSLEELRGVLRQKLLEQDKQRAEEEARDGLIRQIIARTKPPVVPALVERHLTRRIALQKALLGLGSEVRLDEEALKERMRGDATEAVQRSLLLVAIAKKEHVEVQDADIEKRLAEIAAARGQNVARVRSEYEKEGMLPSLRERLLEDKTLDLLMSKANIITEETPAAASSGEAQPQGQPANSSGEA